MYTVLNKLQFDETLYQLNVSLKDVNDKASMDVLGWAP